MKHTSKSDALGRTSLVLACVVGSGLTVAHGLMEVRFQSLSAQSALPKIVSGPSFQEAPNRSIRAILDGAVTQLRTAEPTWTFIGGICSCPPLMDEEEDVVVGKWQREGRRVNEVAVVTIYQISTADAASRWIANYGDGHVAEGWSIANYNLGVPSFLGTIRDHTRYTVTFAKGRFLVTVSGPSTREIDQVARCLLRQIENN